MYEARIDQLKAKLAASTRAGKPLPGYKVRVDALTAELARLETLRGVTHSESGEANPLAGEYGSHPLGLDTPAEPA